MQRVLLTIAFVLSLCPCGVASAEVFKWVDANGKVHFSDRPPSARSAAKVDVSAVNSYEVVSVETVSPSAQIGAQTVTLYATAWCRHCKAAKAHFAKRGIPYVEHDIEKSDFARSEHKRLGGSGVPLIVFGSHKMKGFSPARFDRLYDS